MSKRDTHFAGFAGMLFQELQADLTTLFVALGSKREQDITSAESIIQQRIAQRTYDFAQYVAKEVQIEVEANCTDTYQQISLDEIVGNISDLTKWPKEQDA